MNEVGSISNAPLSIAMMVWLDIPDRLLDAPPVGVCFCDRHGIFFRYNRAASELWGSAWWGPDQRLYGSYRQRSVDGDRIPHAECPMAVASQNCEARRNEEIVIERPDGSTLVALVDIDLIRNEAGSVVGRCGSSSCNAGSTRSCKRCRRDL